MKSTMFHKMKIAVANLLAVIMVVMSIAVITPATAQAAAKKPALNKSTLTLNVGKKYDLNIMNSIAKSVYTWTTSNKKVATVDKKGIVKAVNKGKATIICKVTANKKSFSLKCKITVTKPVKPATPTKPVTKVSDGTATNQAELNDALASNNATITIKTNNAVTLTIAAGDYSNKNLVVDAPQADIINNAKFASVEIKQIKSNTWYENAVGNLLKVLAANSRIVVANKASATIEVNEEGATLTIVNNGEVKKVTISKKAAIALSGDSKTDLPVVVDAAGVKITSSVPLNLQLNAKAELVLNKGAEASKIQAATESAIPTIIGTGTYTVTVGTGTTATTKTVQAVPSSSSTTTDNTNTSTSGGTGGSGGSSSTQFSFKTAISNITAITVYYGDNKSYEVSGFLLKTVKDLLSSSSPASEWRNMPEMSLTIANKNVKLVGKVGDVEKKLVIGKNTYIITANNDDSLQITTPSNLSLILSKYNDGFTVTAPIQKLDDTKTAAKVANTVKSVSVTYNNKKYAVLTLPLVTIQSFINNELDLINTWSTITSKNIDKYGMKITGTAGDKTKKVEVLGEEFTITVSDPNTFTIVNSSNVKAVIIKGTNMIGISFN